MSALDELMTKKKNAPLEWCILDKMSQERRDHKSAPVAYAAAEELASLRRVVEAAKTVDGWENYSKSGGGWRDAFKGLAEELRAALESLK